jgi:hypothetical protein
MRFRLATTGNGLSEGVSSGMRNLFALPMLRAQAEDEARTSGMRRDLLSSQIAQNVAQAAVEEQKRSQLAGRGDVLDTVIATRAGTDVPTLRTWRQGMQTGAMPTSSATGDADTDAAIGIPTRSAIDPKVAQALGMAFQRTAPAMVNPDDFTVQGQADATGRYQTQDLLSEVLAGRVKPGAAGSAVAASKGTAQVNNIGNTGAGFNVHTGEGSTLDQGLRALFGDQGQALVTQRKAAAGASGAQANLSNARRERVAGGYDKPVTILDDDSGEAQITRIPTGADPVTVGVAPKKQTGTDATNAKERNRVVRDVEKDLVGASDAEISAEVDRRMARRGAAASQPPKPAGGAPAPKAPNIDTNQANKIKADYKAGKLTREQATAQLRALGFK